MYRMAFYLKLVINMIFYTFKNHPELEKRVAQYLGGDEGSFDDKVFKNGEYYLKINDNAGGKKIIVLAILKDFQDEIFKLLFLLNALKSNKASKVVLMMPYFPYSRQDRVNEPGEAISVELMANLFSSAGADKIFTIDIHNHKGLGKAKKHVKNILDWDLMVGMILRKIDSSWVIVAPDKGAKKRVDYFAKALKINEVAYLKKHRPEAGKTEIKELVGASVRDKKVIIVDDMIDTGGTLIAAANFLRDQGARQISAAATHGLFSDGALEKINLSILKSVYVTDTLPIDSHASGKLEVIEINELIQEALKKYV